MVVSWVGGWGVKGEEGGGRGQAYPLIREKDALQLDAGAEGDGVVVLEHLVALDVLDRVEQARGAVAAHRPVGDRQHVVAPAGARHGRRALEPRHAHRHAEQRVHAHVVGGCGYDDVRLAERDGHGLLAVRQRDAPVVAARRPRLVRPVVHECRMVLGRGTREQRPLVVEARLVVEEGVGEVEVAVGLAVVELDRHRVVRVLVDGPHEARQVEAQVPPVAAPRRAARLERRVNLGLKGACAYAAVAGFAALAVGDDQVVERPRPFAVPVDCVGVPGSVVVVDKGLRV